MKKFLLFASAVALLASCTKEIAEEMVQAPVEGNATIHFSYDNGAETRTVANLKDGVTNTFDFKWEKGDAIGVFNAKFDVDETTKARTYKADGTNAYFVFESGDETGADFRGNFTILDEGEYVGFYPWDRTTKVEGTPASLKLYISETQNYRSDKGRIGTFDRGTAPAITYGVSREDDKLDMEAFFPVSYLKVPVVGRGSITSLELTFEKDGQEMDIAGSTSVEIANVYMAYTTVTKGSYNTLTQAKHAKLLPKNSLDGKSIILNCGSKGVELDMTDPTYFWFVIPANLNITGATMKVYVNGEKAKESQSAENILTRTFNKANTTYSTSINTPINAWADEKNTPFKWTDGEEYPIATPEEFLRYAYVATMNPKTGFEDVYVENQVGSTLKKAVILNNLDFSKAYVGKTASDFVNSHKTVYEWYVNASSDKSVDAKAIPTIGGELAYYISSDAKDGANAILSNLTVCGNGIFKNTLGNTAVSGITFQDVTVKSPAVDYAYFVVSNTKTGSYEVTIDKGNKLIANAEHMAVVKQNYTSVLDRITFNIGCTIEGAATYEESELYVDCDATIEGTEFKFEEIAGRQEYAIVTVDDGDAAVALINLINREKSLKAGTASSYYWFSVIAEDLKNGLTSYWTGFTGGSDNNDEIFTAEELAYGLKFGKNNTVNLTNTIELVYAHLVKNRPTWEEKVASQLVDKIVTVNGNGNKLHKGNTGEHGLFGSKAIVNDLQVQNIFVKGAYTLAKTGTATKVKATYLNYDGAAAENGLLGGLFYEFDLNDLNEDYQLPVDCSVATMNVATNALFGDIYAKVDAPIGHNYTIPSHDGEYYTFAWMNVYADEHETHDDSNMRVYFEGTVPSATELVHFKATNADDFKKGDTVFFHSVGEATTDNYAVYGGSMYVGSSAAFKDVLNSIPEGADVTISLDEGSFDRTGVSFPKNAKLTFIGRGQDKTMITNFDYADAEGSTVEFRDLTISAKENPYNHTANGIKNTVKATFTNVVFKGEYHAFNGETIFDTCTFYYAGGKNNSSTRYGLWCESDGKTTITDCVFDTACKENANLETKAILVYSDQNVSITGDIEITGCKFMAGTSTDKAAIEIHSEKFTTSGSTLTISNTTYDEATYKGGLYREINNTSGLPTSCYTVIIKD